MRLMLTYRCGLRHRLQSLSCVIRLLSYISSLSTTAEISFVFLRSSSFRRSFEILFVTTTIIWCLCAVIMEAPRANGFIYRTPLYRNNIYRFFFKFEFSLFLLVDIPWNLCKRSISFVSRTSTATMKNEY